MHMFHVLSTNHIRKRVKERCHYDLNLAARIALLALFMHCSCTLRLVWFELEIQISNGVRVDDL